MTSDKWAFENDLSCAVCCELYSDPLMLGCSHSFCRLCLETYWRKVPKRQCPLCRRSARQAPTPNLVLRNVVESARGDREASRGADGGQGEAQAEEARCSTHGERLLLYCLEDEELLCVVCQTTRKHRKHQLCPLEEAAADGKQEMRTAVTLLRSKLQYFQKAAEESEKTKRYLQTQATQTKDQIQQAFVDLHHLLRLEEAARLSALGEEAEVKSLIMEEKSQHLERKVSSLSALLRDLEQGLAGPDSAFLKTYKVNKARAHCPFSDPEDVSGALLDVTKHLSNLKFCVWEKMHNSLEHALVTLDPNTAAPWLSVSIDLLSVSCHGDSQSQFPNNPERFTNTGCVLGAQTFTSGQHAWEVEMGGRGSWALGVAREGCRLGTPDAELDPDHGFLAIALQEDGQLGACTAPWTPLWPLSKPRRVQVRLDCEEQRVQFYNPDDQTLLFEFTWSLQGPMRPLFSPCGVHGERKGAPLRLLPLQVAGVKREHEPE